mmetsp:Transcript_7697/g.15072  ORF Transcript_7697/g.15072 Transcript_7697/m.15072 type:complete len:598 (-) Transcript_7697:661-2454(-)|eukprot:CAMPEP_0175044744 /NCGR_PEP_ID=MMETSP0052_2-20121109/3998_1 /TAXON_ID=51329 ORGANISM="Polytomella parva, Strain SAG 63-3" /NCGR_SAMPLE_ID=MMETSP0052_2 /ASSEMBLY_ACC=CAM_ASM_000194 /LENGTH=597 /DNA_ID=CAMNT_0016308119 /DNA_START=164 /DNA_END=1957 /DNA_ORIENTATION=-
MGCNSSKGQTDALAPKQAASAAVSAKKKNDAINLAKKLFAITAGKRFADSYTQLTLTSYGASCKVLTAHHKVTKQKVAVKTIPKNHKHKERQWGKILSEVGTFRYVEDHPNAVKVLEVYEGAECYYIVMECCEGGELFDHITKKKGGFTERQAAQILHSLMLFTAHVHSKGIAHVDIKPENIMFDSEGANGVLKVIDFGSSIFVEPDGIVHNAFGTVRYASPEMANDYCGQKTDIWSVGVVMYTLLCGRPPFLKSTDQETLKLIKSKPKVKFGGDRWAQVSQSAKNAIKAMLEVDPDKRPTATEVLQMPWLKEQVAETEISSEILTHLYQFSNQSRIRRLLLGLMADQLVGVEANKLLSQFYALDKDYSGTLEVQELIRAAKEAIPNLSDQEIERMFEALDVDSTGTIDIKEFFAGLLQTMDEDKRDVIAHKSFALLDRTGVGFVTKQAFVEVLSQRVSDNTMHNLMGIDREGAAVGSDARGDIALDPQLVSELEQEFTSLDQNKDGLLSFEEFKSILGISSTPEGLIIPTRAGPASLFTDDRSDGQNVLQKAMNDQNVDARKIINDFIAPVSKNSHQSPSGVITGAMVETVREGGR